MYSKRTDRAAEIAKCPLKLCHFLFKSIWCFLAHAISVDNFGLQLWWLRKELFASPMATRRLALGPRWSATVQFAPRQLRRLSPCRATLWQQ